MKKLAAIILATVSMPAFAASFSDTLNSAIAGSATGYLRLKSDDTIAVDAAPVVDVTSYNTAIKGDDSTDNCTALQAAFDANPNATMYFPSGTYRSSCPLILTNASGKAFNGNILCAVGATIKFTTTGSASDTNANMQNGFVSYPKNNGTGGDTSGWGDGNRTMIGCTVEGPANGAGIHLANGISWVIAYNHTRLNRYGIAAETSINSKIINSSGFSSRNAPIGYLYTANPNVYYNTPALSTFWNDNYRIEGFGYADGATNGTLAVIEDHGSKAWTIRTIINVSAQGKSGNTGVQYGYLGRSVFPYMVNFVTEDINYPLRILTSDANEGGAGTNLTGVTAAQPNGTWNVGSMPDGFCNGGTFSGLYVKGAIIAWQPDCNGTIEFGPAFSNGSTTDLKLTQGGGKIVMFKGVRRSDNAVAVVQNSFGGFVDLAGVAVTISSGFGASPSLSSGANTNGLKLTVGTGGVAANGVLAMGRASPNGNGYACTGDNNTTSTLLRFTITTTSTVTVTNIDPTTNMATAFAAGAVLNIFCKAI